MRYRFILFFIFTTMAYGQDTLFQSSLPIKRFVSNVSTEGRNLYLRIGDSIYRYQNGKLNFEAEGHMRFSWIE